jgi:hypothetical protein
MQRQQRFKQFLARFRQAVAARRNQLDKAGLSQFLQPFVQHRRGRLIASGTQRARRHRSLAQFPQNPQTPATPEQIEQNHDRPARPRAANAELAHGFGGG